MGTNKVKIMVSIYGKFTTPCMRLTYEGEYEPYVRWTNEDALDLYNRYWSEITEKERTEVDKQIKKIYSIGGKK